MNFELALGRDIKKQRMLPAVKPGDRLRHTADLVDRLYRKIHKEFMDYMNLLEKAEAEEIIAQSRRTTYYSCIDEYFRTFDPGKTDLTDYHLRDLIEQDNILDALFDNWAERYPELFSLENSIDEGLYSIIKNRKNSNLDED